MFESGDGRVSKRSEARVEVQVLEFPQRALGNGKVDSKSFTIK